MSGVLMPEGNGAFSAESGISGKTSEKTKQGGMVSSHLASRRVANSADPAISRGLARAQAGVSFRLGMATRNKLGSESITSLGLALSRFRIQSHVLIAGMCGVPVLGGMSMTTTLDMQQNTMN